MIELSEKNGAVNRGFGGDTLNTSVYIARQTDASALSVHYVTALGTDGFSQQMLDSWQQENVNTSLIQRMADRLPGLYYIETDDAGERTFYYWRNEAAAKFWLETMRGGDLRRAGHIRLSLPERHQPRHSQPGQSCQAVHAAA